MIPDFFRKKINMANLREKTPAEFKDEVRWFKHLRQPVFFTVIGIFIFDFMLLRLFIFINLMFIGIIISLINLIIALALVCIPLPRGNIFGGSGLYLYQVLFRTLCKVKDDRIYIKNIKRGIPEVNEIIK